MPQLDERIRAALRGATVTHQRVTFPDRLDPDVWTSTAKILNRLGGRYEGTKSAFAFPFDPCQVVTEMIDTGVWRDPVKDDGYVPTPDDIAEQLTSPPLSDLCRMPAGSRVLEPSAGDGAIVRAILDTNDEVHVVALEPDLHRYEQLSGARVEKHHLTFEAYAAGEGKGRKFDGIIMNPPFAVPGSPKLWIDHVLLAWDMLEPGGRLVAVVPLGFTTNVDRKTRDLRKMVEQYGGWIRLRDGAFSFTSVALWLARPVPGQEGQPPWLFRHYPDHVDPVPVREPWLTSRAVTEAPVQVWCDRWNGGTNDRVLRYRAQCWGCGYLLWEFDGANDMALGNHATNDCLEADPHEKVGPTVGLCMTCSNDGDTWRAAKKVAEEVWSKPPTRAAALSLWGRIICCGGMMPVSDAERERYARVQAALRVVFGLSEIASDDDLDDARRAKPFKGGGDRLATLYLREYAARLDPTADLDDLDRWALGWRADPDAPAVALPEPEDAWADVIQQMELFPA